MGLAQCKEGCEYWPRGIAAKVQVWSQGACDRHHRIYYMGMEGMVLGQ